MGFLYFGFMKTPRTQEEINAQRDSAAALREELRTKAREEYRAKYDGLYTMAAYATGQVIEQKRRVLPAESEVRCTQDPSIRMMYSKFIITPADNSDWLWATKPLRDKELARRERQRG